MTSAGIAHFKNSKLPLPVNPVKLSENKMIVAINKSRSQSVSTWQNVPSKIECMPKTRHLSVREEGNFLGRRNSHIETLKRLTPSFGPNGVNVIDIPQSKSEVDNRDLDKHSISVLNEIHSENIPTDEMKTSKDASELKSNNILLEIHSENVPTIEITNNKDASEEESIQKQTSLLKSKCTHIDDDIYADDGMYEYSTEIVTYLKTKEKKFVAPKDFLEGRQVSHSMRSLLADWLIQCQHHLKFCQETLYLAISILDDVLAKRDVEAGQLQLVGVTALLLASKLEEYFAAEVNKLAYLTEQSYTVTQILRMEMTILRLVDFHLHYPDPMVFLKRFARAVKLLDNEMFCKTCQFLLDSHIVAKEYPATPPSLRAAGSVLGALRLYAAVNNGSGCWTDTLRRISGYSSQQVAPVALDMLEQVWNAAIKDEYRYKGAYDKYKSNSLHKRLVLQSWLRPDMIAEAKKSVKCLMN